MLIIFQIKRQELDLVILIRSEFRTILFFPIKKREKLDKVTEIDLPFKSDSATPKFSITFQELNDKELTSLHYL